jgi:HNH endonuclease/AP2 domain
MPKLPRNKFPSHELLLHVFDYDPLTGIFTWKNSYHKKRCGKIAGRMLQGYWKIKYKEVEYSAGPLAWFYVTGNWPENEIDHEDRNRSNNKFSNLRKATVNQNQANASRYNNALGYRGVTKNSIGSWRAIIKFDNKSRHIGNYDTPEKAALAYDQAARNHFGPFATFNFPNSVHRDWLIV